MKPARLCLAAGLGLALLLASVRPGAAWGPEGHRVVAVIADRLLEHNDPATRAKVLALLRTDTANELTKTDIADEATWADVLREKSPEARTATTAWHYIRLKADAPDMTRDCFGRPSLPVGYPASRGPQNDCIIDKIREFESELRSPATDPHERLSALKFLLNLVADIEEPLYAIDRGDHGGRCIALLVGNAGRPVRLLTYWDDDLVREVAGGNLATAAAHVVAGYPQAAAQKWADGTPADWARESYRLAKTVAYDFPRTAVAGDEHVPDHGGAAAGCGAIPVVRVPLSYETQALAAVKQQLAKAGIRLAAVLHDSFK